MKPTDILPPETSVSDRLLTTMFLTALFHLVIVLGITFRTPQSPPQGRVPSLDVMLVTEEMPESERNDQAQYLAQRTQEGAGDRDKPKDAGSPRPGNSLREAAGEPDGVAQDLTRAGMEGESGVLSSTSRHSELVYMAESSEGAVPARPRATNPGMPLLPSLDESGLRLKGAASRELLITPSTRRSRVATYLDAWRRKVERVGTLHFPNEARRRGMSGSPVLEVVLRADGGLAEVRVRRSSGHAELDQAAVGVLKLASPFDPFPPAVAAEHDALRFAYEWQFVGGTSARSSFSAVSGSD